MRSRVSQQRWCGWFLLAFTFFVFVLLMNACTSVPLTEEEISASLVKVVITNSRTYDLTAPTFYLSGFGVHPLGKIEGMGNTRTFWIDRAWLGPEGCSTIYAHYTGGTDLVFSQVCWKPGEHIVADLADLFNPNTAWSHR